MTDYLATLRQLAFTNVPKKGRVAFEKDTFVGQVQVYSSRLPAPLPVQKGPKAKKANPSTFGQIAQSLESFSVKTGTSLVAH